MESKALWKSKTVLLNAVVSLFGIVASLGFLPGLHAWVQANSSLLLAGLGIVGIALRLITKGKIELLD